MIFESNIINIALIDDDDFWLLLVKEKLLKENKNLNITQFNDFELFYKYNNINQFNFIISDFHFDGYNINMLMIDNILKNFSGSIYIITGNPNMVNETHLFDKIINKSHIIKSTFKFSRYMKIQEDTEKIQKDFIAKTLKVKI